MSLDLSLAFKATSVAQFIRQYCPNQKWVQITISLATLQPEINPNQEIKVKEQQKAISQTMKLLPSKTILTPPSKFDSQTKASWTEEVTKISKKYDKIILQASNEIRQILNEKIDEPQVEVRLTITIRKIMTVAQRILESEKTYQIEVADISAKHAEMCLPQNNQTRRELQLYRETAKKLILSKYQKVIETTKKEIQSIIKKNNSAIDPDKMMLQLIEDEEKEKISSVQNPNNSVSPSKSPKLKKSKQNTPSPVSTATRSSPVHFITNIRPKKVATPFVWKERIKRWIEPAVNNASSALNFLGYDHHTEESIKVQTLRHSMFALLGVAANPEYENKFWYRLEGGAITTYKVFGILQNLDDSQKLCVADICVNKTNEVFHLYLSGYELSEDTTSFAELLKNPVLPNNVEEEIATDSPSMDYEIKRDTNGSLVTTYPNVSKSSVLNGIKFIIPDISKN